MQQERVDPTIRPLRDQILRHLSRRFPGHAPGNSAGFEQRDDPVGDELINIWRGRFALFFSVFCLCHLFSVESSSGFNAAAAIHDGLG